MEKKVLYYTLSEFQLDVLILVGMIVNSGKKYKYITGIPRGGIPLAMALSHSLNIPLVTIDSPLTKDHLVVDEVIDSGYTRFKYAQYDFACIHNKCKDFKDMLIATATYCVKDADPNVHIHYWWEGHPNA